jgi:hypothetical protein
MVEIIQGSNPFKPGAKIGTYIMAMAHREAGPISTHTASKMICIGPNLNTKPERICCFAHKIKLLTFSSLIFLNLSFHARLSLGWPNINIRLPNDICSKTEMS